jgi:malonyl CoA-acyl carrier protein transacylase
LKLKEENFFTDKQIQYIFGPSLGEIISLVAGESISLNEAGVMLYFRGKFMQESCPKGEGKILI